MSLRCCTTHKQHLSQKCFICICGTQFPLKEKKIHKCFDSASPFLYLVVSPFRMYISYVVTQNVSHCLIFFLTRQTCFFGFFFFVRRQSSKFTSACAVFIDQEAALEKKSYYKLDHQRH